MGSKFYLGNGYTVFDLVRLLKVDRTTIYKWLRSGKIKAEKMVSPDFANNVPFWWISPEEFNRIELLVVDYQYKLTGK